MRPRWFTNILTGEAGLGYLLTLLASGICALIAKSAGVPAALVWVLASMTLVTLLILWTWWLIIAMVRPRPRR